MVGTWIINLSKFPLWNDCRKRARVNTLSDSDRIILIPFTPKYVHDKHCKPHYLFNNVTMKLTITPGGPAFPGGPSLP